MLVVPTCAHTIGNLLCDLPIRPTTLDRFKNLIEPLDAPLRTGEGAFLFQARCSGQHYIRISARVAEKNVLHYKEVEFVESVCHIIRIAIYNAHFLADKIYRLELSLVNRFHHLMVVEPLSGRQLNFPSGLKSLTHFR